MARTWILGPPGGRGEVGALIAIGGAIGALGRYLAEVNLPLGPGGLPTATLLVNVAGTIVLASLAGVLERRGALGARVWSLVAVGFCGGLTTFSTMSVEISSLWASRPDVAVVYVALSVGLAPLVARLGFVAGRRAERSHDAERRG